MDKEKLDDVLERIADRVKLDCRGRNDFVPNDENASGKRYSEEVVSAIQNAVRYMNDHLFDGIHQEEVAKAVCMSRGYFSVCFKDIAGRPFSDYLRDLKIAAAESLLRNTSKPVYVIADQLGFQDEKYFSKLFREQNGMTPTEFRERNR
ncbi:helix-turn-helix transcriptional regulator [Paenibacillus lycopersici]|uniref:Helix-turn-helix transcriptional regulator n=1 Tax=Paenibacillus lycopersici TaxID=2704462 RepID=A0A6C0FVW1_9BACL|nr:AraC family transcriptional regulator [Paenibacillus lycopersici]QHT60182.1 helix-turn-helix transcriptional regulator [Paenibacillus lycopersici]